LVLARCHGETRQQEPRRIKDCADDQRFPVADPFGHVAENRLAYAPGQILDGNRKAEIRPQPAKLGRDGDLEHPETCPDGKIHHQDQRSRNQQGGKQTGGQIGNSVGVARKLRPGIGSCKCRIVRMTIAKHRQTAAPHPGPCNGHQASLP
jgi:hypothetical protein